MVNLPLGPPHIAVSELKHRKGHCSVEFVAGYKWSWVDGAIHVRRREEKEEKASRVW